LEKFLTCLYFLSATDKELIDRCSSSAKANRIALSLTVLLVSIFAMFSGGFALSTLFHSIDEYGTVSISNSAIWACVFLSLLYGIFIIFLDRSIISSSKSNWFKYYFSIIFRIAIAIIIAMVVAFPLELKLLDDRLIEHIRQSAINENSSVLNIVSKNTNSLIEEKKILQKERIAAINLIDALSTEIRKQVSGEGGRKPTCGKICKELKVEREPMIKKLESLDKDLDDLKQEITKAEEVVTKKVDINEIKPTYDFISLAEALGELRRKSVIVDYTSILIFLFFLILELSAILNKFFSNHREYEALVEAHDEFLVVRINTFTNLTTENISSNLRGRENSKLNFLNRMLPD